MSLAPRRDVQVESLLEGLDHPLKSSVQALRDCILDAGPEIVEGYKWKSPSFRTVDYFATINLHDRKQVRLILHAGAKARGLDLQAGLGPTPTLTWLGADRAMWVFKAETEVVEGRAALQALLRAWIALL
jgi:hypothetical protein